MKIPKARRLPSGAWRVHLRLGGESISITRPTEREATAAAKLVKAEYVNGIRTHIGSSSTLYDVVGDYIDARAAVVQVPFPAPNREPLRFPVFLVAAGFCLLRLFLILFCQRHFIAALDIRPYRRYVVIYCKKSASVHSRCRNSSASGNS